MIGIRPSLRSTLWLHRLLNMKNLQKEGDRTLVSFEWIRFLIAYTIYWILKNILVEIFQKVGDWRSRGILDFSLTKYRCEKSSLNGMCF